MSEAEKAPSPAPPTEASVMSPRQPAALKAEGSLTPVDSPRQPPSGQGAPEAAGPPSTIVVAASPEPVDLTSEQAAEPSECGALIRRAYVIVLQRRGWVNSAKLRIIFNGCCSDHR